MKTHTSLSSKSTLIAAGLMLGFAVAQAGVATDPTRVAGANAIDPSGGSTLNALATGADTELAIEAVTGFGAVQSFSGFSGSDGNPGTLDDFISFSDGTLPDLAFSNISPITSTGDNSVVGTSDATLGTSSGSYIFSRNNTNDQAARSWVYLIDFGSYDSGSGTFTANTNSVSAAAFTFSNLGLDSLGAAQTATAVFYNDAGGILSTQTLTGSGTVVNGLFAHIATGGESIGSIELTAEFGAGFNSSTRFGVDDIGFTAVVPEPSAYALLGGLFALGSVMLRRRR